MIRSKFLHLRHAFLLAGLLLTLTLSGWSDSTTQPSAGPVVSPPASPDPAQTTVPGKTLPASGGALEPDSTSKLQSGTVTQPEQESDDAPVQLPPIQPIAIHAERDFEIGHMVGELLEQNHYLQTPITPEMSQRWLKNYFLALDPTHLFFLQSDIDEFTAKYGNNLGDLLLHGDSDEAGVAPAFEIFDRYMQRVQEDVSLAEKLLHDKFDFTKNETFTIRSKKSPWIADARPLRMRSGADR